MTDDMKKIAMAPMAYGGASRLHGLHRFDDLLRIISREVSGGVEGLL